MINAELVELATSLARDDGQLRMAVCIPRVGEFSIYGAEHDEPARRTDLIMDRATHLFLNGRQAEFANDPSEDRGQQCTALGRGGLCIWLDCLSALRADAESISVINIVAGQIIHKERTYSSIWDSTNQIGQGFARPRNELPKAVFEAASATSQLSLMSALDANFDLQGMASERLAERTITFAYALCLNKSQTVFLQPGILTEMLLFGTGRMLCSHNTMCSTTPAIRCVVRKDGWAFTSDWEQQEEYEEQRIKSFLWDAPDHVSKLVALEKSRYGLWGASTDCIRKWCPLLPTHQYLFCLTKFAHQVDDQWEETVLVEDLWRETEAYVDQIMPQRAGYRMLQSDCLIARLLFIRFHCPFR